MTENETQVQVVVEARVTNGDCLAAVPAVRELVHKEIPVAQAFRLRKFAKALQEHVELIEEQRKDLLHRYAEKDDTGEIRANEAGEAIFKNGAQAEYVEKHNILMGLAWEDAPRLKLDDLGNISVKAAVLISLDPFLMD